MFCPGHHYEKVQVSTSHGHLIFQRQLSEGASGVTSKSLFEKNDFVVTDHTEYNFNVD